MKYIVMEVRPSYAIVLDENGSFRKAANLHYEVGQTVTEIIEMKTLPETEKKRTKFRYLMFRGSCRCRLSPAAVYIGT